MIDTSERYKIALALFDETVSNTVCLDANNRELLQCIDTFITKQEISKVEVQGIMVVVGEGSFTSTRLAVTVANTFAYVQQISVLAISKEQASDPQELISELLEQPKGQYISATYSALPSVNMK